MDFYQEVVDVECRFSIFIQDSSSDQNVSQQVFAFKYNICKLRNGLFKANSLMKTIIKDAKYMNVKCPFVNGTKSYAINQTYDDQFMPPMSNEVYGRTHKEIFGKLKGAKKWVKLFTQDLFFRSKK
jgi:hypothetical protein